MRTVAITQGSQTLTAAGIVTGSADISAAKDWTLYIRVLALTETAGNPGARIVLEDSVDAWTTALPVAVLNVQTPISGTAGVEAAINRDHCPTLRAGTAGAAIRAHVALLTGTSPSITLEADLQMEP